MLSDPTGLDSNFFALFLTLMMSGSGASSAEELLEEVEDSPSGRNYVLAIISTVDSPGGNATALLDQNIRTAEEHTFDPFWFASKVTAGADWDYTWANRNYPEFGNLNYGATGAATRLKLFALQTAGGFIQNISDQSLANPRSGSYSGGPYPYGDEPIDTELIRVGYFYYWLVHSRRSECQQ